MAKLVVGASEVDKFIDSVQLDKERAAGPSQDEKVRDAITAVLGELGKLTVGDDSLLFEGEKFVLPGSYEGPGGIDRAIEFFKDYKRQQEQEFNFGRTFKYRPWDGANAFSEVLKKVTGTTGFGVTKMTMFGPVLPRFETINISPAKTAQVPFGLVAFPPYNAEFQVGGTRDDDLGVLFRLDVKAPRKWRRHIEAIFTLVEEYLKTGSIYRGQAITGAEMPDFLNLTVDPDRVVYSDEVLTQLGANLWTPLEHTDLCRKLGLPLKRAVLLEGPYGSGKTLAGMLTALKAVANGWTFIQCRPGKDDPAEVLKTAQLYAPAVVWIEDIEAHASDDTDADISRLLEMLDGVTNKGTEVMAGFTTNHIDQIQKGALRPGRIDAIIHISGLDESALRKLVKVHVPVGSLAEDVDYARLVAAFEGFQPAFAVEAIGRAIRYTLNRNNGALGEISTDDLAHAADSLRPQLEQMTGAKEGAAKVTVDDLISARVEDALSRTSMDEWEAPFKVTPMSLNGAH